MADSDLIIGRLHDYGFEHSSEITSCDIIILNSCGVKEPTEDRIISRLEILSKSSIPVIVTGCLPRISLHRVQNALPNFGAILGPQSLDSLGPIADRVLHGELGIVKLDSDTGSKLQYYESPSESVVCTIPICEGCIGDCAYCAVKFARSEVQSYSISEILGIVQRCVHNGFKEIRLSGQDIGAFGYDTGESLIDLLSHLSKIPGDHRFRLGMFNPNLIVDKLDAFLEAMDSPRFFEFFHIPLQSGSDEVLRSMNRRYTVQEWKNVVLKILSRFPKATIATDIIVGFPGESDDDFQRTLDVLDEIKPSVINISKYGDRPGTEASKSTTKVLTQIKKNRSRKLSHIVDDIVRHSNSSWIGWSGELIITGYGQHDQIQGRTFTYKPVVIQGSAKAGETVEVTIIEAKRTHLIGRLI